MNIRIFTDGACSSNPGPGGYAALIATEVETKTVTGFNENTFCYKSIRKNIEYDLPRRDKRNKCKP